MMEEWRDVPGYGGHYQASSLGRIRVKDRVVMKRHRGGTMMAQFYHGRLLTPCPTDELGHLVVHLGFGGKKVNVCVHKLVLLAFHGEPSDGQEGCHENGVAGDNRIDNLRWDTHAANNGDRKKHGTYAVGTAHPMAKFTADEISKIAGDTMTCAQAMSQFGISRTHYYRVRRAPMTIQQAVKRP